MHCIGRIAVWISLRRTDFTWIYFFAISWSEFNLQLLNVTIVIKYFDITRKLTGKLKQERRNLTVIRKNYGNKLRSCRCFYGSGVRRRRKKYILMDIGKQSSFSIRGTWWRKYIELSVWFYTAVDKSAVFDCLVPCDDESIQTSLIVKICYGIITIRPHCSTTYVDAAYCYRPSSVVCRSVCRCVT